MTYEYNARCIRVVDGDTVDLEVDLGFHLKATLRFRIIGVDCPETNSKDPAERARATAATEFTTHWLFNAGTVQVFTYKADSFGRWLATIFHGTESLGPALISAGLAVPFMVKP